MRGKIKCIIVFLLFAHTGHLLSQSVNPEYNFKHLNVQNGLAQNVVYRFLQDSYGYIWVGTHNGLTMFDGSTAVSFMHDDQKPASLASNFITRIIEDGEHQVWIGNEKGINLFNRSNNTFTLYGVDRPRGKKDSTYVVPMGFVSPTEFWFVDTKTKSIRAFNTKAKTSQFVCDMDEVDGTIYPDLPSKTIHFWSYQSMGTLHLVFKDHVLIKRQSFFSGSNPFSNSPLHVHHALQQNDSTAWLSTSEGLICLNAVKNTYKIYNSWKSTPVRELRFAALSANNILWIGSGPSGVYTFDINRREFINNFTNNRLDPFSICSNNIVSVYFDKSGNVWCGSYGNGASYADIENNFFRKYTINARESMNNIVWLGLDENENCWCLVEDQSGFWVFDKTFSNNKNIIPLEEDGKIFGGAFYKLLIDDDKHIWCATSKGLYLYDRHTNKMHPVKYELLSDAHFGSTWIRDMLKLRDGSIIFSTFAGLYRITKKNGKSRIALYSTLNEEYNKSFKKLFKDEAENIYVKGDDSLFILKTSYGIEEAYRKAVLFYPEIYQYFSDPVKNVVYLATSEGLYVLDKRNFTLQKQAIVTNIPLQSVNSVFEKDKKLWLLGEKGLYCLDKKNNRARTFTIEDGLPGNEFNVSAIAFSSDGKCIAGSTRGLVTFYPGKFLKNLSPPRAQLDHIYVNDSLYKPAAAANETNNISLAYGENTFAFDFSAIAFQHNREVNYEYKLEGYDNDWIKSGTAHYTRYSKIPPGNYNFKLRVYDLNGILSPFTKELQIEISKAFWQTSLFRVILLLIILLTGWFVVKWYLAAKMRRQKILFEKQQAVEQERTRIAMEMHDDLGSGLTAIRYLAGSLSIQSSPATRDKADKIASSAKSLVDSMNDIIWTMKSDNNTLPEVLAYMRKHVAEQLETAGIDYNFSFSENTPNIKLSSEQKRNLLLISKEAVHNSIKHSGATEVSVTVQIDANLLKLKISDNGKGIEKEKSAQFGNGLKSMNRRAMEMNAELNILNSSGTTIILTLPFG